MTELGRHCVFRLVIARDGGRGRMRPITRPPFMALWGGGPTTSETKPHSVADVSPRWGGRASVGPLELRLSGARQQPRTTTKTTTKKEKEP
nr:MAG TPA: hypothetical protein [Caudoviricetes sp.]